jgi:prepilin-type N-terminal cleavage/methylation domain-containing protein
MKHLLNKSRGFTLVELMVVIVIVGILAAVAIPKFMDASHKAKASEFPTQLTAIYTGQLAYQAENGSYVSTLTDLKTNAGVEVDQSSKWFNYSIAGGGDVSTFTGSAKVRTKFGACEVNDEATIDQANTKVACDNLKKYVPSWTSQ